MRAAGQLGTTGTRYPNEFVYAAEPAERAAEECASEDGIARCLIPECDKPQKAKGFCSTHYVADLRRRKKEQE